MMSVATETIPQTSGEFIEIFAMSESGGEGSKAAKKREYNRNAQRVFRKSVPAPSPVPIHFRIRHLPGTNSHQANGAKNI
jgi:hypothetical protein